MTASTETSRGNPRNQAAGGADRTRTGAPDLSTTYRYDEPGGPANAHGSWVYVVQRADLLGYALRLRERGS